MYHCAWPEVAWLPDWPEVTSYDRKYVIPLGVWSYLFSNPTQKRIEMCYITNQYITGNWTNQIARNEPTRRGWLHLRPRSIYIYSERIVIGILDFLTDHDHVDLREMRQRIYREEQPDQASKDTCRFFTDLFLWDMRQRVQPTRPQKEAWGYPWTAPALHLQDLQPFLPEKRQLSQAFADPPEKNGPYNTDRTKESHQEEKRRDAIPQTEGYTPPPLTEGYMPPPPLLLTEGYMPPPSQY